MKEFLKRVFRCLFYTFRIFKIEQNKIVFSSFNGKGYGESPKYICEELRKDNKYKLYWCVKKYDDSIPSDIHQIKMYTLIWAYNMATAKVWVSDSRMPIIVSKRKKQFYLQTWHSSLRLKKIEKDDETHLPKEYIESAKCDSKMIDLMTCGSKYSYDTYRNSFWYDGPIKMTGTPKFDIYFKKNDDIIDKIYEKYNIPKTKKILLYAPTFRSFNPDFDGQIDFDRLEKEIRDNYVFMVRLHPESKNRKIKGTNVINVSEYPNLQDLLIASDLLITDYSGCCFDCLPTNKRCILYVPDLDEFLQKERNLYFDYNELPFDVTYNIKELNSAILNSNHYLEKYMKFQKNIGLYENGKAAETIADIIRKVILDEKI